ncbi:PREDICTED: protein G12-like [Nicrophorus vespilloides]|uniref:Protein G12-like n=1 Tax=Nicrophorus vespilloides TaxID=110193 RepID=A0ABM1M9A5_NICVS|nr:PREDICTED: protein G12-like [Nicrophorus vespilloides]
MKIAIVLFALVGMSLAAPSTFTLQEDLKEIKDLFPLAEMRVIAKKYLATDEEFQLIVSYLQGKEWAKLVAAVREHKSWVSFKDYLNEAGLDVEAIIAFIHDLIANASPDTAADKPSAFGIRQFLDEIIAIIPKDEILAVVADKMENSADFQAFYAKISSPKAKDLFEEVRAMKEVQRIAGLLKIMGVDVQKIVDFVYKFLGWN